MPPDGNGGTPAPDAKPTTPTVNDIQAERDDTRKALKKANREAAERRKAIEQFEKEKKERLEAELSDKEKLEARVTEMEARAKEAETRLELLQKQRAFMAAAEGAKLNWASEQARQDAVALIDLAELDDDGMVDAVTELKEKRPYLFAQATMPDIDSKKRGKGTDKEEREEAIKKAASTYGIKYVPIE
jgi:hypothetical protein